MVLKGTKEKLMNGNGMWNTEKSIERVALLR